jgi:5-methyltetrahydropteroyltriglutamate--homocysteine methyltransferase
MKPRYRADHIGSLLRPAELLEARNNPAISLGELSRLEDKHILAPLERQKAAGLRIRSADSPPPWKAIC